MPSPAPNVGSALLLLGSIARTDIAPWLALLLLALGGTSRADCLPSLPLGFPEVDQAYQSGLAKADVDVNRHRHRLGERLFHDTRLSVTGRHSCASCHGPSQAFTDHLPRSIGALGDTLPHNAPTLLNAALKFQFNWRSNGPLRLIDHHIGPLTNRSPVEMGFAPALLAPLNQDAPLREMLKQAKLSTTSAANEQFTVASVTALLAVYVSSLSCATAFDQYLLEGQNSISSQAREGMALFTSTELGCSSCHRGPLLGGGLRTPEQAFAAVNVFRPRGAHNVELVTPSLRQVSHSAPYLFDGSVPTLDGVLDQYQVGTAVNLPGFSLTANERAALLAFLKTL
ncbi:MAG: cytochrome-c peroxidase [Pseudomonadales bacterium]